MGNIGIGVNNPFHLNDILSLNVSHSLDDFHEDLNRSYFISYQLPVGYYDLGLSYNDYQYKQTVLGGMVHCFTMATVSKPT